MNFLTAKILGFFYAFTMAIPNCLWAKCGYAKY
jgi:hypothetical protein